MALVNYMHSSEARMNRKPKPAHWLYIKNNTMTQDENDLWSDINNPNNDADMDGWADGPQSKQ